MSLDNVFSNAMQLPTVPKVVQDLIESFQNDDVDVDDLAKKLSMDQSLTAKVLRLANSAHFGGGRKVASVNDAVVLLGFNTLRTMVLASGIAGAFDYPDSFDKKAFWTQAFEVAAIGRWMGGHGDLDKETAFTCGMLHNIGSILLAVTFPEQYDLIIKAVANGGDKHQLELDSLGVTSEEVSAELARRWRFPEEIVTGLKQQGADADSQLGAMLHIAKYLQQAKSQEETSAITEGFPMESAKLAGVDSAALLANIDEVRELESGADDLLD